MPIESEVKIDELHEEALEIDKNFQKATSVEEIISGIKDPGMTIKEQETWRSKDLYSDADFWRYFLSSHIKLNYKAFQDFIEGEDEECCPVFKEGTPDLFEHCDKIIKDSDEKKDTALELFRGQIIVDLGAGTNERGYILSQLLKGKAYIGVNLRDPYKLKRGLEHLNSEPNEHDIFTNHLRKIPGVYKRHIPFSVVHSDALTFLRRLPNNSVSVIMGGFGPDVTNDDYQYRKDISKEINRVLDPKGGFLNYQSHISDFDKDEEMEVVYDLRQELNIDLFICKKKEK